MNLPKLNLQRNYTPNKEKIFKRFNEIYLELNNYYEPGFFEWHEQSRINEWERLFNNTEKSVKEDSDSLCLKKLEYFRSSAIQMLKQYKFIKQKCDQIEMKVF